MATKHRSFSFDEIKFIKEALSSGMQVKAIADTLGRTSSTVSRKIRSIRADESSKKVSNTYILNKIPPREIINYLYDLGYRIKDGKLMFIQEVEVKLNDILNEKV